MGIVYRQSAKNVIVTYIGFGIGAINTLFLYTRFMSEEYYGLIGVILSTAALLTPLMAFGVPNSLVKFFSSYKDKQETDPFLSFMLFLPLVVIIPLTAFSWLAEEMITGFLARKNSIVQGYMWYIFWIGVSMAYFEVFFAWSKVQLRSVFGNFLKEIFVRTGIAILLILLHFKIVDVFLFLELMVALYVVRTGTMAFYSLSRGGFRLRIRWNSTFKEVLGYSMLIILGGSSAIIILEIDRFMINQFIAIENVAYYTVAVFIAIVIAVPARAMHQITYPLTAQLLNSRDFKALKELYQKSSLSLFVLSGLIFVLIITNLGELYTYLPTGYRDGFFIVFLIGLTKVYDALIGINNSILYNSKYYKATLVLGLFLALCTIVLNGIFIPRFGINGAAFASFLAILIYNTLKLFYVKQKFQIQPFTEDTLGVFVLLVVLGILFCSFDLPYHPLVNIAFKSILIVFLYLFVLFKFNISRDIVIKLLNFYKTKEK